MCLAMLDLVMAGHVTKLLFLMALSHVVATGEKQAACKKPSLSLMRWLMRSMLWAVGLFLKEGRQVHNPFGWQVAVKTGWLW